ncbi:MAG: hypothetical protein OXI70_11890 [Chloroflexota bacterium]|nr:hypothetical protein [Chloroflexota bacterium]
MASMEQRVSFIEGKLDSLATKADLAELESRLIKWMVGMMFAAIAAAASIALLVQRLIEP